MPLLFTYGTLQREDVQLSTFGRRLSGTRDELVGYESSLVPIADPELAAAAGMTHHVNAAFTGRPESRVRGTAFEVTSAEIALADTYEQRAAHANSRDACVGQTGLGVRWLTVRGWDMQSGSWNSKDALSAEVLAHSLATVLRVF